MAEKHGDPSGLQVLGWPEQKMSFKSVSCPGSRRSQLFFGEWFLRRFNGLLFSRKDLFQINNSKGLFGFPGWLAGSWNESLKTLWISYLYKYVLVIPQKFILLGRLGWLKVLQKMSSQICWLCPFPVTYSHHQDDEHTFLVSRMTN